MAINHLKPYDVLHIVLGCYLTLAVFMLPGLGGVSGQTAEWPGQLLPGKKLSSLNSSLSMIIFIFFFYILLYFPMVFYTKYIVLSKQEMLANSRSP